MGVRMKILCVVETLGRGGGAEQLIVTLVPALRDLGVEIEFLDLFYWHDDMGKDLEREGFVVHRAFIRSPWAICRGYRTVCALLKGRRYDVIWGNLYFGNVYANLLKLAGYGLVSAISIHSEGYGRRKSLNWKLLIVTGIERLLCSSAEIKVAVSEAVRKDYAEYFGWSLMEVVHNGIDTQNISQPLSADQRVAIRASFGLKREDALLAVVPARFVKVKGHEYLVRAIAKIRDHALPINVLFVGSVGEEQDRLKKLVRTLALQDRIKFIPVVEHSRLMDVNKSADMVILPSLYETFGIAAAEAMCSGTPTILTQVDGYRELVGESGGAYMVPPADENALAEAIIAMISSSNLRSDIARRGKERVVSNFDLKVCAAKWHRLFDAALKGRL